MRGTHSFRSDQTEAQALSWFDDKVHKQVSSRCYDGKVSHTHKHAHSVSQLTRFNVRRGAKHGLVKAFYAFQKLF